VDPPGSFDTVSPEIVPVYLMGVRSDSIQFRECMGHAFRNAAVGEKAHVGLFLPASAKVVLEVYHVWVFANPGMAIMVGYSFDLTVFATSSTVRGYTHTVYAGANGAGEMRTGSDATSYTDPFMQFNLPSAESVDYPFAGVVVPGRGIGFVGQTNNVELRVGLAWRERPLLPYDVP
jgi:hypothetical protein